MDALKYLEPATHRLDADIALPSMGQGSLKNMEGWKPLGRGASELEVLGSQCSAFPVSP